MRPIANVNWKSHWNFSLYCSLSSCQSVANIKMTFPSWWYVHFGAWILCAMGLPDSGLKETEMRKSDGFYLWKRLRRESFKNSIRKLTTGKYLKPGKFWISSKGIFWYDLIWIISSDFLFQTHSDSLIHYPQPFLCSKTISSAVWLQRLTHTLIFQS